MVADDLGKPNYWTHGTPAQPHSWRYLGKRAQAYHCGVCDMRVSKPELKGATDA